MSWDACSDPSIGYDLSHWQGKTIPWKESIALGVRWVVSKTWHGSGFVTASETQLQGAIDAGVEITGRYAWMLPDYDVREQCKSWLSIGRRFGELPLTIDFEEPAVTYRGKDLVEKLELAIEIVSDKLGERPILYTGNWYWSAYCLEKDSLLAASCPLWIAAYPRLTSGKTLYQMALEEACSGRLPTLPAPWRKRGLTPLAWQFDGDKGLHLPNGVDVDVNTAAWSRLSEMALKPRSGPRQADEEPVEEITVTEFLSKLFSRDR